MSGPQRNPHGQSKTLVSSPYKQPHAIDKPDMSPGEFSNVQRHTSNSRADSSNYTPPTPSSAYSSPPGSRRESNIEDDKTRYQTQPSPKQTDFCSPRASEDSTASRASKRRQFNEFFDNNQKLRDSLGRLDQLYSDDAGNSAGSAFQFERIPRDDSADGVTNPGNPFSLHYAEDTDTYPQSVYDYPQNRYSAASGIDSNNNANDRDYPSMERPSARDVAADQPQRNKAFEKHRMDPKTGRYTEIRAGFQRGFNESKSKEEYV